MRVVRFAHHAVVDAWRERERELRRLGADVRLVSAASWNEGGREIVLDAAHEGFVAGARTLGRHPNGFLYSPRTVWRALSTPADLLDLHEEPFALATAEILLIRALRRIRTPYVLYSAQNLDKRYPVPIRWFERWALRGAAGAYVCNREAGEILVRKGLRVPATLIPLGVDTADLAPADRQAPREEPVVGYVGRLEPHKGVATLIEAAALRPGWRLEITGDGPERPALEALVARRGLSERVAFLGFAAGSELAERYRRLDVLAVPSLPWPGWREQFGRVAVEAAASGVPVVASRTGALPDVIGEAGVLVEPGDAAALAEGVDAAREPDRWRELRARGLAGAEGFAWGRVAAAHLALYRGIVPDRDAGRPRDPHVVVVAYGDPGVLTGALDALGPGFALTIVDNSSLPETRRLAEERGAHYIDPGANLGFGAGVNRALRSLRERGLDADDVLLLNPDARIGADGVRALQRRLHAGRALAAVGAAQVEPGTGAPVRVWWPFPTPGRAWLEAIGLGRLDRARDFAIGSILLLRAEAIREIGEFDERFFLYAEEVDWQKRAVDAGWRIAVADVEAAHEGAGTGGDPGVREALFFASTEKFQRKHHGAAGWALFRAALVAGAAVRAVALRGERRRAARRRLRIFWTGPVRYAAERG